MSIQFTSTAQEIAYRKVTDYLTRSDLFHPHLSLLPDRPGFQINYGSAKLIVEVLDWNFNPWENAEIAVVKASSCLTVGSRLTTELMQYLLIENSKMRFGAFHLDESGQVWFSDSVLAGKDMEIMELQACILAVATVADSYDDRIAQQFGGQRFKDI